MYIFETEPPKTIKFQSDDEKREKLKQYEIHLYKNIHGKRSYREYYYKDSKNQIKTCIPYGYEVTNEYETLIIKVENKFIKINFDYFGEMQSINDENTTIDEYSINDKSVAKNEYITYNKNNIIRENFCIDYCFIYADIEEINKKKIIHNLTIFELNSQKNNFDKIYDKTEENTEGIDIYEEWEKIEMALHNKTALIFYANYFVDTLITLFNSKRAKFVQEQSKIDKSKRIPAKKNNLRFDFVCMDLVFRRVFTDYSGHEMKDTINSLDNKALIPNILNFFFVFLRINTLQELKHISGITLGQSIPYKISRKISIDTIFNIIENDFQELQTNEEYLKSKKFVESINVENQKIYIESENYFYPCLPITETEVFRNYDFKKFLDSLREKLTVGFNQIDFNNCNDLSQKGIKNITDISKEFVIIDVETTGRSYKFDQIIEIAAIKISNDKIVDKFNTLVKPSTDIPSSITDITGITNEMVKDAPELNSVLPQYIEFIGNNIIMGYNVTFDINFINANCNVPIKNNYIDLLQLARKFISKTDVTDHKLSTIAQYYSIDISGNHRSLKDCEITYECYLKLINDVKQKYASIKSFSDNLQKYKNNHINVKELKPRTENIDKNNPFFDKNCCFTGDLETVSRKDAMQLICDLGGKCQNGVTKKTNYLILGGFDGINTVEEGKSTKLLKAQEYKANGQDIKIISEKEFLEMIKDKQN